MHFQLDSIPVLVIVVQFPSGIGNKEHSVVTPEASE